MKIFSKDSLKKELREIAESGWYQSLRDTSSTRNDGAAGNLLEHLLGIEENNLPLPNAAEWELKVQRRATSSLMTLFHCEPSPTSLRFVPQILLPYYGWPHKDAGGSKPANEKSFRMTMNGGTRTDRGFMVVIDKDILRVSFDANSVSARHSEWLKTVENAVGLGELDPTPYWGFEDLRNKVAAKLHNTFYVGADVERRDGQEWFRFTRVEMLKGFSFNGFLNCLKAGEAFVEFDASTGHNHGTKFRIRQASIPKLYSEHALIFDLRTD